MVGYQDFPAPKSRAYEVTLENPYKVNASLKKALMKGLSVVQSKNLREVWEEESAPGHQALCPPPFAVTHIIVIFANETELQGG